jgi:hypothetical protein
MANVPTGQISTYFTWKEMLSTNTGLPNVPTAAHQANLIKLAQVLDILRGKYGAIEIVSGYRSPALQAQLIAQGNTQAAAYSLHQEGIAADIRPLFTRAQRIFADVAANPALKALFGEFAIKTNTIHLSLPTGTKQSVMMYVTDADEYKRFTADELNSFITKYRTPILVSGILLLTLALGVGGFLIYLRMKRKKS